MYQNSFITFIVTKARHVNEYVIEDVKCENKLKLPSNFNVSATVKDLWTTYAIQTPAQYIITGFQGFWNFNFINNMTIRTRSIGAIIVAEWNNCPRGPWGKGTFINSRRVYFHFCARFYVF